MRIICHRIFDAISAARFDIARARAMSGEYLSTATRRDACGLEKGKE
jgi:hypothetical protein